MKTPVGIYSKSVRLTSVALCSLFVSTHCCWRGHHAAGRDVTLHSSSIRIPSGQNGAVAGWPAVSGSAAAVLLQCSAIGCVLGGAV